LPPEWQLFSKENSPGFIIVCTGSRTGDVRFPFGFLPGQEPASV
jgi:hypothetical protein